jgi:hypothetical protein
VNLRDVLRFSLRRYPAFVLSEQCTAEHHQLHVGGLQDFEV